MLGLGGLYLFGLTFRIFPIGGMVTAGAPFSVPDLLRHLALPALILGVGYVAILMRYTRSSMLEVIGSLYVTTAVAKGLPQRVVVTRHAFRNALIPIITIIGLSLPELVGGAVIIETVFSWPGLGNMMVEAVQQRDYPMIMGLSLIVGGLRPRGQPPDGRHVRRRRPTGPIQLMATQTQTQPQVVPDVVPGTTTFVGRPVERPIVRTLRRFAKHRMAVVGVIVIAILVILAIVGNEAEALKQNLGQANKPPSPEHWWGTDRNGRDILARTLVGGRVSLAVGLVAAVFSTCIGTILGAIAGFYPRADLVIMRVVDIVMSFPTIILLLIAVVGPRAGHHQHDDHDRLDHLDDPLPDRARPVPAVTRIRLRHGRPRHRRVATPAS